MTAAWHQAARPLPSAGTSQRRGHALVSNATGPGTGPITLLRAGNTSMAPSPQQPVHQATTGSLHSGCLIPRSPTAGDDRGPESANSSPSPRERDLRGRAMPPASGSITHNPHPTQGNP